MDRWQRGACGTFGQGKYQAGPAAGFMVRIPYGTYTLLALNLFSYAGDPERSPVNELIIQSWLAFKLPQRWWIEFEPTITRNWLDDTWEWPFSLEVGKRLSPHYAASFELILPFLGTASVDSEYILKLRYFIR